MSLLRLPDDFVCYAVEVIFQIEEGNRQRLLFLPFYIYRLMSCTIYEDAFTLPGSYAYLLPTAPELGVGASMTHSL